MKNFIYDSDKLNPGKVLSLFWGLCIVVGLVLKWILGFNGVENSDMIFLGGLYSLQHAAFAINKRLKNKW